MNFIIQKELFLYKISWNKLFLYIFAVCTFSLPLIRFDKIMGTICFGYVLVFIRYPTNP